MTLPTFITPRVEFTLLRASLLAVTAFSAIMGGCQQARVESMRLGDGPLAAYGGSAGARSEAVFDAPEANEIVSYYGREALPELARLDGRMSIATPSVRLATNQWPQDPAPDANDVRIIFLPVYTSTSSQAIPVYQRERPPWRGHHYYYH
ncbi:MAG: hypothetical protein Q8L55_08940 [Phycisphaerales bacterium]|nr:hypothetical protein [Phycisphaerales bacterium]